MKPTQNSPLNAHTDLLSTAPKAQDIRYLSDAEKQQSMLTALQHRQAHEDIWIYGYGSLIWNPEFEFEEQRLGTLRGYHRSLCLWSRVNRGTPERPGLVFGLDRGGSCKGMAFRVAAQNVPEMFPALWKREMSTGAYLPRWLRCDTDQGTIQALAFVIDRSNIGYLRQPADEQAVSIIEGAAGRYGHCVDYVVQTYQALQNAGIHDARLHSLTRLLLKNDKNS